QCHSSHSAVPHSNVLVAAFMALSTAQSSFHAHGDAHAAANAQGSQTLPGPPALHLMEQRCQHTCSGSSDRVADSDRAAINIDDVGVPAELLVHCTGLRGEGFVGFHKIEIVDAPPCLFQGAAAGWNGSGSHDCRIHT